MHPREATFSFLIFFFFVLTPSLLTLTFSHQHPNPEHVVKEVLRRVNESVTTRRSLQSQPPPCPTGNSIDDCWRCDPNWGSNRQRLADCGIGFGKYAMGGKGGEIYMVTDSSDEDPLNPKPGTLRYGVIQEAPLWIIFQESMAITLNHELLVGKSKTIDGRGVNVQITGKGCIVLRSVTNVIISSLQIYNCVPSKAERVRLSPDFEEEVSGSDGDGISVQASSAVWIDHCTLANCADGLIDVTEGSTAVTISNNYFSHHDKVMLLGHSDDYPADKRMQVTVAFNRFGERLGQRMPRCRFGHFHVFNNDYSAGWGIYAIGGSAQPTINSQNNRFVAPDNPNLKEVTRREESSQGEWSRWNWRTDGDIFLNGANFVASGSIQADSYTDAESFNPAGFSETLTQNAGVLNRNQGNIPIGGGGVSNIPGSDQWDIVFTGGAPPQPPTTVLFWSSSFLLLVYPTFCSLWGR
ncbi:unnamed protein product [Cuscuta campestris]|uniref:Pectate lyase n=1 Tax=Cuscuta campestris TaxID=132261 RepID=A0A484KB57_9ASTE|nr:unnamed protein product [Cuscuta campestris]